MIATGIELPGCSSYLLLARLEVCDSQRNSLSGIPSWQEKELRARALRISGNTPRLSRFGFFSLKMSLLLAAWSNAC